MKAIKRSPVFAVILFIVAAAAGCQEQSDDAKRNSARNVKPGPEESFEMIVETFRRGVEDVPIGFVSQNSEGHSMMSGRNEVSHELIRPAKEGDSYKAVITVGSQSRYSIQRSTSEDAADREADERRSDSLGEVGPDADLEVFDRDLVSRSRDAKPERRSSPSPSDKDEHSVTREVNRHVRKYELLYQNGKWKLITQLDPETEQSIENAFKRALELQI